MKKIVLVIGARPNFMKAFPLYEALKNDFDLTLIHTGQHFDEKMSKVFFEQLKFPRPDIHLSLEKKTKAGDYDNKLYIENKDFLKDKDAAISELMTYDKELGQLGEIRNKLVIQFNKLQPDLVIVFGDVTSTLAAALAAKKATIEIAHVESGLRSNDMKMPEEVNRILTDHITKYYFVTEQSGVDNLTKDGITENVYLVGNTMIDTQKKYLQQALNTKYHKILGLKSKEYVLITLHRPSNVDDHSKLQEIFDDFEMLSKKETLVYPIHPRTKNNLERLGYLDKVKSNKNIILCEPLGYLEFTCLMANCKYVVTDSGGIQEETTALDIPCFTLRENTERPCTLIENHGTNQMISKISEIELKECKGSMDLWDGRSSFYITYFININIIDKSNMTFLITNLIKIPDYYKCNYYHMIRDNAKLFINHDNVISKNCIFNGFYVNNSDIVNIKNISVNDFKKNDNYGTYYKLNIQDNKIILKCDFFANYLVYYYLNNNNFIISDSYINIYKLLKYNDIKLAINLKNVLEYEKHFHNLKWSNDIDLLKPYEILEYSNGKINICNNMKNISYFNPLYSDKNNDDYKKYIVNGVNEIKMYLNNIINYSHKHKLKVVADLTAGYDSKVLFSIIMNCKLHQHIYFNCDKTNNEVDERFFSFYVEKYNLKVFESDVENCNSIYDIFNYWNHNYNNARIGFPIIKEKKYIRLISGFGELYRIMVGYSKKFNSYKNNHIKHLEGKTYIEKLQNYYLCYENRFHHMHSNLYYHPYFHGFMSLFPLQSKYLIKASRLISYDDRENNNVMKDIIELMFPELINYNINDSLFIDKKKTIKLNTINLNKFNNIKNDYIKKKNNFMKNCNKNTNVNEIMIKEIKRLQYKFNLKLDFRNDYIKNNDFRNCMKYYKILKNYENLI